MCCEKKESKVFCSRSSHGNHSGKAGAAPRRTLKSPGLGRQRECGNSKSLRAKGPKLWIGCRRCSGAFVLKSKVSNTALWSTLSIILLTWPKGRQAQLGVLNEMDLIRDKAITVELCQSGGRAQRHALGQGRKFH